MDSPEQNWVPYEQAKRWVRRLNIPNYKAFLKYVQDHGLPEGIPRNPQITYGSTYISDSDFLGTERCYYLPYYQAKYYARTVQLTSRSKWLEWHREQGPKTIPRHPDRVYEEWETWGEFLGTDNVPIPQIKRNWRPYNELIKYVHKLELSSEPEWRKWISSDGRPDDIPKWPERVYNEWGGWPEFLGYDLAGRLKGRTVETNALYIVHELGMPDNVFIIGVDEGGKSSIIAKQQKSGFRIVKIYKYDPETANHVKLILSRQTSPWNDTQLLVSNVHQLVFELDGILDQM